MPINKHQKRLIKQLEPKRWVVIFAILFKILLGYSYVNFVSPVFLYAGMSYEFSLVKYTESWLIFFFFLYFSPALLTKPSDYLITFLNFSYLAPLLVFYSHADANRVHLYYVLLSMTLIHIFKSGRLIKFPFVKQGKLVAYSILVFGISLVSGWMVLSGGLVFFNLDLTRVYEYRSDVGDVINDGVMGYLNVWATKVFGPVLLAIFLWRKYYILSIMVFLLYVFWFGVSSHKSVLFYPFMVTFIWMWFRHTRALSLIPIGMLVVLLVSISSFLIFDQIFVSSMLIRRAFFVPAHLTFVYFEFFSQNEFVYWSNSILSGFFEYNYNLSTAHLIGDYLGTEAAANNSFLATGYMHAGLFGVILYGILGGLIFRTFDSLAQDGVPPWFAVCCLIVPSYSFLISSDLPTALLTHGIGMSIVILFLLRSKAGL